MAKLYFKFGAMGCSKTAQALITKFNYEERNMNSSTIITLQSEYSFIYLSYTFSFAPTATASFLSPILDLTVLAPSRLSIAGFNKSTFIYSNDKSSFERAEKILLSATEIKDSKPGEEPLIYCTVE